MKNKFSLEIKNPSNPIGSIKKILTSRSRSDNQGSRVLVLCHPLGKKYYQSYKEAISAGFDQVITYCEWLRENLPAVDVALEDERGWLARNLGIENSSGMVNTLYASSEEVANKRDPQTDFDKAIIGAGYMPHNLAAKKIARKETQDNYIDGEIVALDADYIQISGIKAMVSYAQRNEIALCLHIPSGRVNQKLKSEIQQEYGVELKAELEDLVELSDVPRSSMKIKELVNNILESASRKSSLVVITDNIDFRLFFEIALANSDIPFSALDGSIVGRSRGVRAYSAYINFLMSDGVELLKDFCGEIRVDYPGMVKLARSKKESLKFSDYRRIITECFFTDMNREASLLLDVIEGKRKGVNQAANIFNNAIDFQLNDFEKYELSKCLEIIKDLDISDRIRVFSRLQHYQLSGNFKIQVCSLEYALQNHVGLNESESILVQSHCGTHEKAISELKSISSLSGITNVAVNPESSREVA